MKSSITILTLVVPIICIAFWHLFLGTANSFDQGIPNQTSQVDNIDRFSETAEGKSKVDVATNANISVAKFEIISIPISNVIKQVQTPTLKRNAETIISTAIKALESSQMAVDRLKLKRFTSRYYNNRSYITDTDNNSDHYSYDFWNDLRVIKSIKKRNKKNVLVFSSTFYENGNLRTFSTYNPEQFVEFHITGALKVISLVGNGQYYNVQWSPDGKFLGESQGFVP